MVKLWPRAQQMVKFNDFNVLLLVTWNFELNKIFRCMGSLGLVPKIETFKCEW